MIHNKKWMIRIGAGLSAIVFPMVFVGSAFAASTPAPGESAQTTMVINGASAASSNVISPNGTSPGDCGTARLTMFNGGSKTKIDAHWSLTAYVGFITWENVEVRLSNGDILGYDGPGPIISNNATGQVTFSGLKSKTTYQGTLTGSINVEDPLDPLVTGCEIIPTTAHATTR